MNYITHPVSIDWELTSACNHDCIHCYNYWRKSKSNFEQTLHNQEYYLNIAKKIIDAKPVSVQITGGEPMIVWKMVEPALELLIDNNIVVSFNTNATFVTEEIADFLKENNIDAFVSIPCSREDVFDKIVNLTGAAKRAFKGISLLINAGVRVSLNMVVTRLNKNYVYETAKFVKEKFGVSYFSATKASFPQNADKYFKNEMLNLLEFNSLLFELMKVKKELNMRVDSAWVYSMCGFESVEKAIQFGFNRKCTCGKYSFVINSQGDIKGCGCESDSYGNIMSTPFETAIKNMKKWRDGSLLPDECKSCVLLKYCGGGCRSDAYSMHSKSKQLDTTANKENVPNIYAKIIEHSTICDLDENAYYSLNPEACFVEESNCYRISYKTNYAFISKDFYEFLKANKSFCIDGLKKASDNTVETIAPIVFQMLKKKFVVESSPSDCIYDCHKYDLMVNPFCAANSPRWLLDYLNNDSCNRRYA